MSNIQWEPAEISPRAIPGKKAYVRVSKTSVTFNAVAARLIENIEKYPWANVFVGNVNGEPTMLAFKFAEHKTEGALPVRKQSKNHKGVTFFSRELVKKYFKFYGVGLVYLQLDVEKLDEVTLGVHLQNEKELTVGIHLPKDNSK